MQYSPQKGITPQSMMGMNQRQRAVTMRDYERGEYGQPKPAVAMSDYRSGEPVQPQSAAPDMSAWKPGQAQPKTQSFGTPYGSRPQRQAFEAAPAQTPWGPSMDPFRERDAFVQQINQQRMQNQLAFNSAGPVNPVAGMMPGIDYQKAMQQAGLGSGAPSMQANYGDSMIQRLNQAFGAPAGPSVPYGTNAPKKTGVYVDGGVTYWGGANDSDRPPAPPQGMEWQKAFRTKDSPYRLVPAQPLPPGAEVFGIISGNTPPGSLQPFVNNQGQPFRGSMSFAPGTSDEYRNQAFQNYANQQGFFQPTQPPPIGQAQPMPDRVRRTPPMDQPQTGQSYYPGFDPKTQDPYGGAIATPRQPGPQQFSNMYAAGTDITKLPWTDTVQPNPLYSGPGWRQVSFPKR